jgi:hypothetical protein
VTGIAGHVIENLPLATVAGMIEANDCRNFSFYQRHKARLVAGELGAIQGESLFRSHFDTKIETCDFARSVEVLER